MTNGTSNILKITLWIASGLLTLNILFFGWVYTSNQTRLESIERSVQMEQAEITTLSTNLASRLAILETQAKINERDVQEIKADLRALARYLNQGTFPRPPELPEQ